MRSSKGMLICLGSLIFTTILVDTYFLSWPSSLVAVTRRNHPGFNDFFQHKAPDDAIKKIYRHGSSKTYAEVTRAQQRATSRHFKFQDPKNEKDLPLLVPEIKPVVTEPIIIHVKEQPPLQQQADTSGNKVPFDASREPILKVFAEAGIPPLNASMIALLPTWDQIVKVIGPHPVVGGLDTCDAFKRDVPAVERMLGAAGMFNTGTNLVTHLLKGNCKIPERVAKYGEDASKEMHGMRWQVPWGKHSPAKFKEEHSTEKAKGINKEWIMPIVTIRHPYSWMSSMCKNAYTAKWHHGRKGQNCPNLKDGGEWNEVITKFADGRTLESDSIAHLWNDWYKMYLDDAKYPRLIVRLEDMVFHARETTETICTCVGGVMEESRPFKYVLDSAKADSRGHDTSTGFIQAWIKYSKDMPLNGGFTKADFEASKEALNSNYMEQFHYNHAELGDSEDDGNDDKND